MQVLKVGRSRTTDGVINGVESCLSVDENGRVLKSMEWCIIAVDTERPFSRPGDSGALIIDKDDVDVVGLLWGGLDNGVWHDRTYFTPIEVVAKDIFKETGYHVQLQGKDICCKDYLKPSRWTSKEGPLVHGSTSDSCSEKCVLSVSRD